MALQCVLQDLQTSPSHWWCKHAAASQQFLPCFGNPAPCVASFKDATASQLSSCIRCQLAYHECQRDVQQEMLLEYSRTEVDACAVEWETYDVHRITSFLRVAASPQHDTAIVHTLYELMAYPYLLDDPGLNRQLTRTLLKLQEHIDIDLPSRLPGLFHLAMHQDRGVRCWAQSLLGGGDAARLGLDDCEKLLAPALQRFVAILDGEELGTPQKGGRGDRGAHGLPPWRHHYARSFQEFWSGLTFVFRQMSRDALAHVVLTQHPHLGNVVANLVVWEPLGAPQPTPGKWGTPTKARAADGLPSAGHVFHLGANVLHIFLSAVGPRLWQHIAASARYVVEVLLARLEASCRDGAHAACAVPASPGLPSPGIEPSQFVESYSQEVLTQTGSGLSRTGSEPHASLDMLTPLICLRLLDVIYSVSTQTEPATARDLDSLLSRVLDTLLTSVPGAVPHTDVAKKAAHTAASIVMRFVKRGRAATVLALQEAWCAPLVRRLFAARPPSVTAMQVVFCVLDGDAAAVQAHYRATLHALAGEEDAAAEPQLPWTPRLWHALAEGCGAALANPGTGTGAGAGPALLESRLFVERVLHCSAQVVLIAPAMLRALHAFLAQAEHPPPSDPNMRLLARVTALSEAARAVGTAAERLLRTQTPATIATLWAPNAHGMPGPWLKPLLVLVFSPVAPVSDAAWAMLKAVACAASGGEAAPGRRDVVRWLMAQCPQPFWEGLRMACLRVCGHDGADPEDVDGGAFLDVALLARYDSLPLLCHWLGQTHALLLEEGGADLHPDDPHPSPPAGRPPPPHVARAANETMRSLLGDAALFVLWQAAMGLLRNAHFLRAHSESVHDHQVTFLRFLDFFPTLWVLVRDWAPDAGGEYAGLCPVADQGQWLLVLLEAAQVRLHLFPIATIPIRIRNALARVVGGVRMK